MKLFGALILLLAALGLSRGYGKYISDGIGQAEAFREFFVGLKSHLSLSGAPIDVYISAFDNPILNELGFLREYERSKSLYDAFLTVRARLFMPNDVKRMIEEILFGLGKGSLSSEIRFVENGLLELKELITQYKTEAGKSARIVSFVIAAVVIGILIFLL